MVAGTVADAIGGAVDGMVVGTVGVASSLSAPSVSSRESISNANFQRLRASGGRGARLSSTTLADTENLAMMREGGSVYFVIDHVAIRRYAAGYSVHSSSVNQFARCYLIRWIRLETLAYSVSTRPRRWSGEPRLGEGRWEQRRVENGGMENVSDRRCE